MTYQSRISRRSETALPAIRFRLVVLAEHGPAQRREHHAYQRRRRRMDECFEFVTDDPSAHPCLLALEIVIGGRRDRVTSTGTRRRTEALTAKASDEQRAQGCPPTGFAAAHLYTAAQERSTGHLTRALIACPLNVWVANRVVDGGALLEETRTIPPIEGSHCSQVC